MYFTMTGLPASLQTSSLNPAGFATGTLTIQGTPSAADVGVHQVQITAQNAVGVAAQQTLLLEIVRVTAPAPSSGTGCNGNYNGTFTGNITVSPGQNCAFFSGGVVGNITVTGGNLVLTDATVSGNVVIQGSAAFVVGAGSVITGNLTIQNLSSSTGARVCGTEVGGNLRVLANAIPIQVGSQDGSCLGNAVGTNLAVQDNTGAISIYGNHVAKNLSCSGNTAIGGSGNLAGKKIGQCSGF